MLYIIKNDYYKNQNKDKNNLERLQETTANNQILIFYNAIIALLFKVTKLWTKYFYLLNKRNEQYKVNKSDMFLISESRIPLSLYNENQYLY